MLDASRVTVLGGGRRKIATADRRGQSVDRYEVRWRAHLRPGGQRDYRRRFDRAADADEFIRRLKAVGLAGSTWGLDDEGRPVDCTKQSPATSSASQVTLWSGLVAYRAATWRGASGNGRKAAALTLRAMAKTLKTGAPAIPPATLAYLDLVAFRRETEPDDMERSIPEKLEHDGRIFCASDIVGGRAFLDRWSLPIPDLDRSHVRRLIAELGHGRAASTERRRWTQMRAVLRWWRDEGLITNDVTSRVGVIRGTSVPTLGDDEAIPDEHEMWSMAWALCLTGKPQYGALPLVMGGGGLRIGECCELRRRDCIDDPNGGMWLSVRGTLAKPGRSWTDSGEGTERRGTKAKGPDGDLRGRRTYLPPSEASILRTHLMTFTGRAADAYVFTSMTGKPLDVSHLQERAWKHARELAFPEPHRLHGVGRHAFRHLAATRWLRAGVPLRTAARWGGWKDVATMLRWYESRLPGDDEFAANRMSVSTEWRTR
ncbi:MAG: tyrosine-type recombinase/integrase [Acidimicrobiales bacterium]